MTEDNELIEIVALAIGDTLERHGQRGHLRAARPSQDMLNACASAALTAYRNHEVEL